MKHAEEPPNWREDHAKQRGNVRKRTFTVVGNSKVKGKRKGETVELEFTEAAIDALIQWGFIEEQGATKPVPAEEAIDALFEPIFEDIHAAHAVAVSDSVAAEDLAGTAPVETRGTRAQSTKKG